MSQVKRWLTASALAATLVTACGGGSDEGSSSTSSVTSGAASLERETVSSIIECRTQSEDAIEARELGLKTVLAQILLACETAINELSTDLQYGNPNPQADSYRDALKAWNNALKDAIASRRLPVVDLRPGQPLDFLTEARSAFEYASRSFLR